MKDKKKADFEFEYQRNGENGLDHGKCVESQDLWEVRRLCR